jgi:5-methylcytosine-specific restriction endonuclease McrA
MICKNGHYVSGNVCKLCDDVVREERPKVRAIKKKSDKRAKAEPEYNEKRKKFLKENPRCQAKLEGCTGKTNDLHHRAGREGSNYTNEKTFMAVCRNCHDKVHTVLSAKEAREKKLKI